MKKKEILLFSACVVVLSVFLMGCSDDSESPHNDPSGLVGTWKNDYAEFVIAPDFTFVCDLEKGESLENAATVTGVLSFTNTDLGPDDYELQGLTTPTGTHKNQTGNDELRPEIARMFGNGLVATLALSPDKGQFTFSSTNIMAKMFFGRAPYTRVLP